MPNVYRALMRDAKIYLLGYWTLGGCLINILEDCPHLTVLTIRGKDLVFISVRIKFLDPKDPSKHFKTMY